MRGDVGPPDREEEGVWLLDSTMERAVEVAGGLRNDVSGGGEASLKGVGLIWLGVEVDDFDDHVAGGWHALASGVKRGQVRGYTAAAAGRGFRRRWPMGTVARG